MRLLNTLTAGLLAAACITACSDMPTGPRKGELGTQKDCVSQFCNGIRFSRPFPDTIRMAVGSTGGSGVDTATFDLSRIPADSLSIFASLEMSSRYGLFESAFVSGMIAKDKKILILLPIALTKAGYDEVIIRSKLDPTIFITIPVVIQSAATIR
jgi:hypothetical protein